MAKKKDVVVAQAEKPKREMWFVKKIRELEEENKRLNDELIAVRFVAIDAIAPKMNAQLSNLVANESDEVSISEAVMDGIKTDFGKTAFPPEAICCAIGQALRFIRPGQGLYTRPNALVNGEMWTAYQDNVKRGVRLEARRNRENSEVRKYFIDAKALEELCVEAEIL